ncbi:MAG TPA: hypothetical protein VGZ25_04460 [Gemmataceae bacterium]|nr:hypothetical protein [Gemmataceae bacterium]
MTISRRSNRKFKPDKANRIHGFSKPLSAVKKIKGQGKGWDLLKFLKDVKDVLTRRLPLLPIP